MRILKVRILRPEHLGKRKSSPLSVSYAVGHKRNLADLKEQEVEMLAACRSLKALHADGRLPKADEGLDS